MVIGIDASRAIRKEKTGVEWYARHVIEHMVALDDRVRFRLYCDERPDSWLQHLGGRANVEVRKLNWGLPYFWTQGRLSLGMAVRKPDALFIPASAMPLMHPRCTVMAVHDVAFMRYPETFPRRDLAYLKWATQYAARCADTIITISEFSKRDICELFDVSPERVVVTPLAYDHATYREMDHATARAYVREQFHFEKPYLLFVGRLEKKKNITRLLEAFALFKEQHPELPHELVLVGKPNYGWKEAQRVIEERKLQKLVHQLGYVPQEHMPQLYAAADAFVFTTLYEGFGIPVLEAMACGTPVIASDNTALPEVVGDAGMLVDPHDTSAIALACAEVVTNDTLRADYIKRGLTRAAQFQWNTCAKNTLETLQRCLYSPRK